MPILQGCGQEMISKTHIVLVAEQDILKIWQIAWSYGRVNFKLRSHCLTMEAEYVSLSASCKDLFLHIDISKELCSLLGLDFHKKTDMHIKIHKDNVGTFALAKLKLQHMTPHPKHNAIKYHWF
jgi:hypothetical protein